MAHVFDPTKHGINFGQEFQSGLTRLDWGDAQYLTDEFPFEYLKKELTFLKSVGIRRLRWAAPNYTWRDRGSSIWCHTQGIPMAAEMGFHIEWGIIVPGPNKPEHWVECTEIAIPYAQWFQSVLEKYGVTGKWMVGNESAAYGTYGKSNIVSIERASNVVTIVTSYKHGYEVGRRVNTYSNSVVVANNNNITEIVDEYTFRFNHTGSDASDTTGQIEDNGPGQIRNRLKSQATAYLNAGITIPLVYSCLQGWEAAGFYRNCQWQNYHPSPAGYDSLGDLTEIHHNCYGSPDNLISRATNETQIYRAMQNFKDEMSRYKNRTGFPNYVLSEIGLRSDDGPDTITGETETYVPKNDARRFQWYKERLDYCAEIGIDEIYLFSHKFYGGNRQHLAMGTLAGRAEDRAMQPIFDYFVGRPTQYAIIDPIL